MSYSKVQFGGPRREWAPGFMLTIHEVLTRTRIGIRMKPGTFIFVNKETGEYKLIDPQKQMEEEQDASTGSDGEG